MSHFSHILRLKCIKFDSRRLSVCLVSVEFDTMRQSSSRQPTNQPSCQRPRCELTARCCQKLTACGRQRVDCDFECCLQVAEVQSVGAAVAPVCESPILRIYIAVRRAGGRRSTGEVATKMRTIACLLTRLFQPKIIHVR